MAIPLYSSQFALLDFLARRQARRLERDGLAKVVRHQKAGAINRVVVHRRPGEPHPRIRDGSTQETKPDPKPREATIRS